MADLDIAAFLRARLDEREAVALAAQGTTEGRWEQVDPVREAGWIEDDYREVVTYDEGAPSAEQAVHIADNDPAFVLVDVAAKRMILDAHESLWTTGPLPLRSAPACKTCSSEVEGWPCRTLRLLALPYAGHPDYREEWKP